MQPEYSKLSPEHQPSSGGGARRTTGRRAAQFLQASACLLLLAGCRRLDMYDQPKHEPLEPSSFFEDGLSSRQPVEGTVARGELRADTAFYSGVNPGAGYVTESPLAVDQKLLERGQERFNIFCSPCHSRLGDGRGMIVQRGFKQPSSFHTDRLRSQPLGYFVDVITNGFGTMPSYAYQVPPNDRWAIAAYITALQLSQNAAARDLPPEDVDAMNRAGSGDQPRPQGGSYTVPHER